LKKFSLFCGEVEHTPQYIVCQEKIFSFLPLDFIEEIIHIGLASEDNLSPSSMTKMRE
jgi:hypothetical protein